MEYNNPSSPYAPRRPTFQEDLDPHYSQSQTYGFQTPVYPPPPLNYGGRGYTNVDSRSMSSNPRDPQDGYNEQRLPQMENQSSFLMLNTNFNLLMNSNNLLTESNKCLMNKVQELQGEMKEMKKELGDLKKLKHVEVDSTPLIPDLFQGLKEEMEELKDSNQSAHVKFEKLMASHQFLSLQNQHLSANFEDLKNSNQSLFANFEDLEKSNQLLRNDLKNSNLQNQHLSANFEDLKNSNQVISQDLKNSNLQNQLLVVETQSLKDDVGRIERLLFNISTSVADIHVSSVEDKIPKIERNNLKVDAPSSHPVISNWGGKKIEIKDGVYQDKLPQKSVILKKSPSKCNRPNCKKNTFSCNGVYGCEDFESNKKAHACVGEKCEHGKKCGSAKPCGYGEKCTNQECRYIHPSDLTVS